MTAKKKPFNGPLTLLMLLMLPVFLPVGLVGVAMAAVNFSRTSAN